MRALFLSILALTFVALKARAADTAQAPAWLDGKVDDKAWTYVFSADNDEAVFVSTDELFFDDWPKVSVWSRHEFRETKENDGYSVVALLQYDCSRMGKAEYARYVYPEVLLGGEPEATAVEDERLPRWDFPEATSGMGRFISYVCALAAEQRPDSLKVDAIIRERK